MAITKVACGRRHVHTWLVSCVTAAATGAWQDGLRQNNLWLRSLITLSDSEMATFHAAYALSPMGAIGPYVRVACLQYDAEKPSPEQRHLLEQILRFAGFDSGSVVRIWSEITVRFETEGKKLNYRLDYVMKSDDGPPVIVEIMTASTSGGNRRKRTDIQSAFCDAVLYAEGNLSERGRSPGVNVRQVWARMASQMIAKSQIANAWGGMTIWVVQDALLDYIRQNTGLRLDNLHSPNWDIGEVNMVSASIDDPENVHLYSGPIRSLQDEACWAELLNTPIFPPAGILHDKLDVADAIAEIYIS